LAPEAAVGDAPRWSSVRARPTSEARRAACLGALFAVGAQGVHEEPDALVTHFPPGADLGAVQAALEAADPGLVVTIAEVPPVDWSEAWKARIVAHDLGAIRIAPPWLVTDADAGRTVVIEPGMAFGTGDHPTTRGVVRLLSAVVRPGDVVADLGAGSAVLAIAAARFGAARVFAIELDGEAIPDAEANVVRNGVADRVHVFEGDAATLLPLVAPVRVVLANIISSVLVELLPVIALALAPDGVAILSGILWEERPAMLRALADGGWRVLAEDHEDIWWSASVARD
jgi:ribosomal protein L11 methyltransferase